MTAGGSWRISLRQLLLLVVVFAIACIALKYANGAWQSVFSAIVLLSFMVGAVVALVGRGAKQSFAIGFVTCVLIYTVVIHSRGVNGYNREMNPYSGTLLTSMVMRPLYQQLATQVNIDVATGKPVSPGATPPGNIFTAGQPVYRVPPPLPADAPSQPAATVVPALTGEGISGGGIGGGMGGGWTGGGLPWASVVELPNRNAFMAIGHALWSLLLGYVGGHFARFVYMRRQAEGAAY